MAKKEVLHLTPTERGELQLRLRKQNLPASVPQRMRIVPLLDEGVFYRDIEEQLYRRQAQSMEPSLAIRATVCISPMTP